jgi:hypothetical protein
VKQEGRAALRTDALMTTHEVEAALDVAVNVEMVFIALSALCWDGFAVAIRDRDDEPLYFCRARRGAYTDSSDLYAVRTAVHRNRPHPVARYTAQAEQSRQ